jgi:hypothetical protein
MKFLTTAPRAVAHRDAMLPAAAIGHAPRSFRARLAVPALEMAGAQIESDSWDSSMAAFDREFDSTVDRLEQLDAVSGILGRDRFLA